MSLDSFLDLPDNPNVEVELDKKGKDVEALEYAESIQKRKRLSKLDLPSLPDNFHSLLGKTIADVSSAAEQSVRTHIGVHTAGATEEWLEKGTKYLKDDTCPFCEQSLTDGDLVASYAAYFSEAYRALNQEINDLSTQTKKRFGEAALGDLQRVVEGNEALCDFWSMFTDIEVPTLDFDEDIHRLLTAFALAANADIVRKKSSPLDVVVVGDSTVLDSGVVSTVGAYNVAIEAANEKIAVLKDSAKAGGLDTAKQQLAILEAAKIRHVPTTIVVCDEYKALLVEKKAVEKTKQDAKGSLDKHSETVFQKYSVRINQLLENFNAGFRIGEITSRYAGGHASSDFHVVINDMAVHVGDSSTPRGTPSFRSTLSAGDRSTLALAFFLATLEQEPNLCDKVVVFDDPFTSQDRFRRTCTQQLVCEKAQAAKQVILFSHDPYFLKHVWDNVFGTKPKTLQLTRAGRDNAVINEWNIEEETRSGYFQDHAALTAFLHHGTGTLRDVARKVRPLLEGYLRVRFPNQFPANEWLGGFIDNIRMADTTSPLDALRPDGLRELENINDYSKKYHHDQNPGGCDTESVDDTELQGFVRRTLQFVGGY